VFLVQRWLQTLLDIGYKFPSTARTAGTSDPEVLHRVANAGTSVYQMSSAHLKSKYRTSSFKTSRYGFKLMLYQYGFNYGDFLTIFKPTKFVCITLYPKRTEKITEK
jgi:hypothetical protein